MFKGINSLKLGAETASRRHNVVLSSGLALAVALLAMFLLPTGAQAFNVSGFTFSNSSTQAAGHPDVTIAFNRQGTESEDLKDIELDLPTGVFANPESVSSKCTATQFNADGCPAGAQVGTVKTTVKALGLLDLDIHGTVDILVPDSNQVATLGLTLRPEKICILFVFCAQPQKIFLKTGVTIKTYEDSGLRTYTPGSPRSAVIGIPLVFVTPTINGDITINKLSLTFQSRSGTPTTSQSCSWFVCTTKTNPPSGPFFWTQTGSCTTATAAVKLISYQGAQSSATTSFTPTGCTSVPFNPSIAFSVANSQAGASTNPTFQLNIPDADANIQNSLPKIVDVDFPMGSGIDLNALTGVTACTEAQLKAMACPASSKMGTANAFSKYLPNTSNAALPGLTGSVYAMGVGNQVPIGVQLIGPRGTVVIFRGTLGTRGDANVGTGRAYSLFDRIPQLPFRQFNLTITRPVYKNPDSTCGVNVVNAAITGFNGTNASGGNGTVVNRTVNYNVSNCAPAPQTTITNSPPSPTTNRQPAISFTSSIAGSTFQCKYDSNTYQACSSPFTPALPLSDGSHTFSVVASNGLTADPSPATVTFTVATGADYEIDATATPSTYAAAAHPDFDSVVDVSGGQPKSVSIKMPAGLNASLTAVPLCSTANAAAGTCAATSKVGTIQLTANTGGGPVSGVGDVFLTEAPTANDAGGVAVKVPLSIGTFIAQGGAFLVNNGNNQNLEIRNFPTIVNGTDITITQLVLHLDGDNRFLTNASNCSATDGFVVNSKAFDGTDAPPVAVAYQANCSTPPPFNPTLNLTLSNPTANQISGINANVTVPIDNSTIRTFRTTLPPSLGPNYGAFGESADQCASASAPLPTSVFNPASCPAQSLVGTMTITTPLLATPLVGQVYLINKNPLPWFGVKFDQPGISVRLTGVTALPNVDPACIPEEEPSGFCQSQISAVFNNLPDVPITNVAFNLNGPDRAGSLRTLPGKLLQVVPAGDPSCAPGPARSVVTPFAAGSGTKTLTQTINIGGC